MRITDSTVNMFSGRNYTQTGMRSGGGYASSFMGMIDSYSMKKNGSMARDTYQPGRDNGGMGSYNMDDIGYFRGLGKIASGSLFGTGAGVSDFQNDTLSAILRRFVSFGVMGGAGIGGNTANMVTYAENETTGFHAFGRASTEDGRTIDFEVNILMSRSYMECMKVNIPTIADALCDPLVVNTGSDTADVRDQTFRFDLDADGNLDEISMPGKGSGFLALDKDGNGKIDDGSELFGAKTGDGFGELREYDSDGNGWIDENDEVFSKLKVWCKDENGKDILMDLKEADIGAIYLGAQETEFSLGGEDGYRDGVIRSTGVFLRESSGAGTIQHVDLSLKQNGSGLKVSGDDTLSEVSTSGTQNRQSNAARRREERRRREARARKRRADEKAAEETLDKRRREHKEYLDKLQEKQFMERKEYRESLNDSRSFRQPVIEWIK
ncbi:MAG: hypothetical protein K6G42_08075 [Lachnospiraceae bacterium]|nr:hypothetical protein [Lachnospiraceae bacterium]